LDIPIKKPREHINSAPGSFNEAGGSPTALRQQDETPRFKPLFLQLKFQVMNRKKNETKQIGVIQGIQVGGFKLCFGIFTYLNEEKMIMCWYFWQISSGLTPTEPRK